MLALPSAEELRSRFKRHDIRHDQPPYRIPAGFQPASVLIPLFYRDGQLHVLLTVRSKELRSHSGLVAFPGGKKELGDKDESGTALRESHEEIGLPPESVDVIAVLPHTFVRPNMAVTLVVGLIPEDFVPKPCAREVAEVFSLPLARFLRGDRTKKNISMTNLPGTFFVYYYEDTINGKTVTTWGFTALYCALVALVAFNSDMPFEVYEGVFFTNNEFSFYGSRAVFDVLAAKKMNKAQL
jgi:coenzyme A diphosphatase NUDT7